MVVYAIINSCVRNTSTQEANVAALAKAAGIDIGDIKIVRISGNVQYFDIEYVLRSAAVICADADIIMLPGNQTGSRMAIELSCILNGSGVTGAVDIDIESETVSRKVFAGNMVADYQLGSKPWCISVDPTIEEETPLQRKAWAEIVISEKSVRGDFCSERVIHKVKQESNGLSDGELILACGQGFNNKSQVEGARDTAKTMGAQMGASRPVVMSAWSDLNTLVGVSGNITRPKVCIAAAVSGAPAFFAGIEKSNVIIAINSDENAPIMKKSDLAVVGDATVILEELKHLIEG